MQFSRIPTHVKMGHHNISDCVVLSFNIFRAHGAEGAVPGADKAE